MDQKLLAALRGLTANDFAIIYGPGILFETLLTRFTEARETNDLQLFLLSLTSDQQADLARYLKVIVSQQPAKVHGTFNQLHAMCTWLNDRGRPFFIEVLDHPQMTNGADFAVLVAASDYQQYQQEKSHVSAA